MPGRPLAKLAFIRRGPDLLHPEPISLDHLRRQARSEAGIRFKAIQVVVAKKHIDHGVIAGNCDANRNYQITVFR